MVSLKMDWVDNFERKITIQAARNTEKRSIYRVPAYTKMLHREAYMPLEVSFGPYHCEDQELKKKMEEHKSRALHHFLLNSKKPLRTYVNELQKDVLSLMEAYDILDVHHWHEDNFLEMMLLDGCFMLEILRAYSEITRADKTYGNYGNAKEPIFSYHGIVYMMPHIRRDMLLLENQLPMDLLRKLLAIEDSFEDLENYLNKLILDFVNPGYSLPPDMNVDSLHVLDLHRKSLIGNGQCRLPSIKVSPAELIRITEYSVRTAAKLYEVGIDFKPSTTTSLVDISFNREELNLPITEVDGMTESIFLNLMAFEKLHVGAGNEVTSFLFLMGNIIQSAKDVSILQSRGIIQNFVGSEKAVANIFNGISRGVTADPEGRLLRVYYQLQDYCNIHKEWKMYCAELKHTYFQNPWAMISLLAAIFLIILTTAQTLYAIITYHHPPP